MVTALRHIVRPDGGQYLFEEFDVAYYYLHDQIYPGQVTGMFGFLYWDQARHAEIRGVPAFRLDFADRSFDLVEVDGQNIPASSTAAIEQTLARTRGYRLIFKQRWGPTSSTAPSHGVTEIWRLTTP
jgi:hypothetical protein